MANKIVIAILILIILIAGGLFLYPKKSTEYIGSGWGPMKEPLEYTLRECKCLGFTHTPIIYDAPADTTCVGIPLSCKCTHYQRTNSLEEYQTKNINC
jgi:hypothetical protein